MYVMMSLYRFGVSAQIFVLGCTEYSNLVDHIKAYTYIKILNINFFNGFSLETVTISKYNFTTSNYYNY